LQLHIGVNSFLLHIELDRLPLCRTVSSVLLYFVH